MNTNLSRFEHMLRSRSRSFQGLPSPTEQADDSQVTGLEKSKNCLPRSRRWQSSNFRCFLRLFSATYKVFVASVFLGTILFVLLGPESSVMLQVVTTLLRPQSHEPQIAASPPIHPLNSDPPAKPRPVPLVDRSILQRLADLEISPDPDERPYFASDSSNPNRPPIVARIPEARRPLVLDLQALDICGPTTGTPCRFLLPLRIGEEESRARVHLMEILQLAQRLDRILVLPNVGKGRIGTCFKSGLETYYDLGRLSEDLEYAGGPATVKSDLFRRWVSVTAPSAQLGFLSSKQELSHSGGEDDMTFANDDVLVQVGSFDTNEDLPGCLARFPALRLDAHAPLYIHLKPHAHDRRIAASIVDALTRPDIQAAATDSPPSQPDFESTPADADPAVLILTWDLRASIFPTTTTSQSQSHSHSHSSRSPLTLHYAPRLHALAALLAPPAPYAMVHWPMYSVPSARLPQCAYALVDVLARLGPGLGLGGTGVRPSVWFASDYPYAVHRSRAGGADFGAEPGGAARKFGVGTRMEAGPLHAEAVGILGDAFAPGGELEGWELAELTDARVARVAADADAELEPGAELLVGDAGVRAIVEKIIGMRAAVFVSGATPGCASRSSSFTRQVVDERRVVLGGLDDGDGEVPVLQNVVEHFGIFDVVHARQVD
ncbi:hypothetical protein K438DRAFT_2022652 [Mycena galopus ATCC 62051]|nr:hypothetical protein K438DRAFT_2022652 [Mycena galopus ATCC 62051]